MQNTQGEHLGSLVALTQNRIPVLLRATGGKRDGRIHVLYYGIRSPDPCPEVHMYAGADVRVVPMSALGAFVKQKETANFEKEYGAVHDSWRAKFFYLLQLAVAPREGSDRLEEVVRKGLANAYLEQRALADPIKELGRELNTGVKDIVFSIWWSDRSKRFSPGLFCPDSRSALYALALTHIGEPGGIACCLHCNTPFIKSRRHQSHCSSGCQTASASARHRNRKTKALHESQN